jgi:SEC-C motif domain protein
MVTCYCGSSMSFADCCQSYLVGTKKAPTAEALMRSRYSAFATGAADYLVATTHLSTRKFHKKAAILAWSKSNQWVKLEVLAVTDATVTFKAYYLDARLQAQVHQEHSTFVLENGCWYYVDGSY